MLVLLGIAFLAGLVTSLSPCVLPVLPIVLAASAAGDRRRPFAVVGGLVVSFTVFTLTAAALLDAVHLPPDFLRNAALALLFVVAATLAWPRLARAVERPFVWLTRIRPRSDAGGFVLGASLGLVFVPCAGPVLAAVAVTAATRDFDVAAFAVTGVYAAGAGVPMLAIALAGQRAAAPLRRRARTLRPVIGLVIAATAAAIALGADTRFQTAIPGYTAAFQEHVESSVRARRELDELTGRASTQTAERALGEFGPAPELRGIAAWINTDGEPLSLARLRGKVVLVDFWTYSCINCLRTLPYLEAWDRAYRERGLVIVGVHSPEFAFEREPANVRRAVSELGLRYAVALDNDFVTWRAFRNQYWPAKYLIDRDGIVRFVHFGEGRYDETERAIRAVLGEEDAAPLRATHVRADAAASESLTPETYLGSGRLQGYVGTPLVRGRFARYAFAREDLLPGYVSYAGRWMVEEERVVAGSGARLRLAFRARAVHLVLSGRGRVRISLDGRPLGSVRVTEDRLYTLLRLPNVRRGLLELRLERGVAAYAFTFG